MRCRVLIRPTPVVSISIDSLLLRTPPLTRLLNFDARGPAITNLIDFFSYTAPRCEGRLLVASYKRAVLSKAPPFTLATQPHLVLIPLNHASRNFLDCYDTSFWASERDTKSVSVRIVFYLSFRNDLVDDGLLGGRGKESSMINVRGDVNAILSTKRMSHPLHPCLRVREDVVADVQPAIAAVKVPLLHEMNLILSVDTSSRLRIGGLVGHWQR